MHFIRTVLIFLASAVPSVHAQTTTVINPETGGEVNLTRAYWNPNVDIANRTLTCEWYVFDTDSGQIRRQDTPLTFEHNPLPTGTPSINSALIYDNGESANRVWIYDHPRAWTVDDGVYDGPMPLRLSEYVEEIAYNSTEINAVRVWHENFGSFICFDANGEPFLPSGSAGTGNTNLVDLPTFSFEFPKPPAPGTEIPEIYSLSTGEKVELVRGIWNYADIANHMILCASLGWDGQAYVGQPDSAVSAYLPYNGGDNVVVSSRGQDIEFWLLDDMSVDDVVLTTGRFGFDFMELTDTGYRMWGDRNTEYYNCTAIKLRNADAFGPTSLEREPLSPISILSPTTDGCDYSDAALYNGWGWNPSTRTSCPPVTETRDNCDYSSASSNDGWGWNNVTRESCPPLETEQTECVDTDGDGWGWDGTQSCIISTSQCIDSDGDGWGWDGVQSCRI